MTTTLLLLATYAVADKAEGWISWTMGFAMICGLLQITIGASLL